ncbi:Domain of unknown function DUF4091 [Plasmopara halstedii]|uniref:Glycoside hydrolase 123 catalytic domain-containing protein n=1 Tax=Plasmopara halstedii TaxID=4781 RepID=A0A0P1B0I3_PLAHL|nr:Domain of unknown function DUF4091 [Plasmopara halstedii]CEG47644.1 Domain of unknown function DUF4091 [Plasmopara halstedii]|eukprot:XP_024584013.1 Domain of unknown function DUF4091 [Plasmopara halstedii]
MASTRQTSATQSNCDFSGGDERIRSTSESCADHSDDDASMSNDESMSSTSSLEIESHEQRLEQQQSGEHRSNRTTSLDDVARQLPYHGTSTSLAVSSFSYNETDTSSTSHAASTQKCWLLTQFAPAMSKSMKCMDSSGDMDDEEPFDEESERLSSTQTPGGNRRVAWATSAHLELSEGVRLTAARNEVTGTQLRFKSNVAFLLTTDTSNWMMPFGHGHRARVAVDTRFVPPHLIQTELFVIGAVEDENADLVMETLERTGFTIKAAKEHAVYLRIRIAETLDPGLYELPIRVFTQASGFREEHLTWSSNLNIQIVDVCLPTPSRWRFRLDLWQHWTAVARTHRVALWSEHHFELIDQYLAPLSEMGQKCLSIVATEMPWAGQQCYMEEQNASALFEHAILEVYEDPSHGVPITIDFTHFDRLLELGARHQVDQEIEVFGLLSVWRDPAAGFNAPAELTAHHIRPFSTKPDSTVTAELRPRSLTSESTTSTNTSESKPVHDHKNKLSSPCDSPRTAPESTPFVIDGWRIRCQDRTTQTVRYLTQMSEVESFIQQFYKHCVALEITDRIRICADEPRDVAVFHEQLRFMQRLAPDFRLKLAVNHSEFFSPNYAPPQVADYVPLLPLACADLEITRRLANEARARGGHVCWYVCCSPAFPNQFVSSPLVEGELVGYLTFFFELDGFLRWNYCLWPARPWDDLRWRAPMWKVGDMYFVLPGLDGRPVETLRLESLRFAGQAFELLALARDTLAPAQMQQLQRTVAEEILRSSNLEDFGRYHDCAREDLYSLDPLDYQRARTIILDTLAAAAIKNGLKD